MTLKESLNPQTISIKDTSSIKNKLIIPLDKRNEYNELLKKYNESINKTKEMNNNSFENQIAFAKSQMNLLKKKNDVQKPFKERILESPELKKKEYKEKILRNKQIQEISNFIAEANKLKKYSNYTIKDIYSLSEQDKKDFYSYLKEEDINKIKKGLTEYAAYKSKYERYKKRRNEYKKKVREYSRRVNRYNNKIIRIREEIRDAPYRHRTTNLTELRRRLREYQMRRDIAEERLAYAQAKLGRSYDKDLLNRWYTRRQAYVFAGKNKGSNISLKFDANQKLVSMKVKGKDIYKTFAIREDKILKPNEVLIEKKINKPGVINLNDINAYNKYVLDTNKKIKEYNTKIKKFSIKDITPLSTLKTAKNVEDIENINKINQKIYKQNLKVPKLNNEKIKKYNRKKRDAFFNSLPTEIKKKVIKRFKELKPDSERAMDLIINEEINKYNKSAKKTIRFFDYKSIGFVQPHISLTNKKQDINKILLSNYIEPIKIDEKFIEQTPNLSASGEYKDIQEISRDIIRNTAKGFLEYKNKIETPINILKPTNDPFKEINKLDAKTKDKINTSDITSNQLMLLKNRLKLLKNKYMKKKRPNLDETYKGLLNSAMPFGGSLITAFNKEKPIINTYTESLLYNKDEMSILKDIGVEAGIGVYRGVSPIISFTANPIKSTKELVKSVPYIPSSIVYSIKEARKFPIMAISEMTTATLTQEALGNPFGKALSEGSSFLSKQITKLSPKYKKVTVSPFGIKEIKGIKGLKNKNIDVVLVKGGRNNKLPAVDIENIVNAYGKDMPFAKSFKLPKIKNTQLKKIVDVVRNSDDIISGSYAQKALLKKEYTRPFSDLDISSKNVPLTVNKIINKLGRKNVKIKKGPRATTIIDVATKKELADIVPINVAEAGYLQKYPPIIVEGVKLANPISRLAGKTEALNLNLHLEKTIPDIESLIGGKESLSPLKSGRSGFGFSFKEQSKYVGLRGTLVSGQRSIFKKGLFGTELFSGKKVFAFKPNEIPLEQSFFASPFDIPTGKPLLRATRLGVENTSKGNLFDLISGKAKLGAGQQPQILLFENYKISNIPSKLKTLYKKAKTNPIAREKFFKEYLKYQLTPSSEFRPFGFNTSELEVTTYKPTLIKKAKIGSTIINNKVIPIYSTEIESSFLNRINTVEKNIVKPIKQNTNILEKNITKPIIQNLSKSTTKPQYKIKPTKYYDPYYLIKYPTSINKPAYKYPTLISEPNISYKNLAYDNRIQNNVKVYSNIKPTDYNINRLKYSNLLDMNEINYNINYGKERNIFKIYSPINKYTPIKVNINKYNKGYQKPKYKQINYPSINTYNTYSQEYSNILYINPPKINYNYITYKSKTATIPSIIKTHKKQYQRKSNTRGFKPSYAVEVKVGNKWKRIKIDNKLRDYYSAMELGKKITRETVARSFRLVKLNKKPNVFSFIKPNMSEYYISSKIKNPKLKNAFIEKSKYAINTEGELKGITVKGWLSNKKLKIKPINNIFNIFRKGGKSNAFWKI